MESMYSSFVKGLLDLPDLAYAWVTAQAAARRVQRPMDATDEPARALQRRRGNNDVDDPMEEDSENDESKEDVLKTLPPRPPPARARLGRAGSGSVNYADPPDF